MHIVSLHISSCKQLQHGKSKGSEHLTLVTLMDHGTAWMYQENNWKNIEEAYSQGLKIPEVPVSDN